MYVANGVDDVGVPSCSGWLSVGIIKCKGALCVSVLLGCNTFGLKNGI